LEDKLSLKGVEYFFLFLDALASLGSMLESE